METTYELRGAVCGPIWWPTGAICGKEVRARLDRLDYQGNVIPFRDMIDAVMTREDGDFQSARFTADTYVEIIRTRANGHTVRRTSRFIELANCPSVADMVDPDAYSGDFSDDFDQE